jgi:hypothetical protein
MKPIRQGKGLISGKIMTSERTNPLGTINVAAAGDSIQVKTVCKSYRKASILRPIAKE